MNNIYIGYDPREVTAYRVCVESLRAHVKEPGSLSIQPVNSRLLGAKYRRPESKRDGRLWDEISNAPMSTEFSIARFFVPAMQRTGWALYCDCDFLWRAPVDELFELRDPKCVVQVVKHEVDHGTAVKMDNQIQTSYARKNWSSLMLFNCDMFTELDDWVTYCNSARGLDLHQLHWAGASVGGLPVNWNWLEGVSPDMEDIKAVHYTRGTPDMKGYESSAYADEWRSYAPRR
jgi:hypothetical protein